jgi:hypothetical protein
LADAEEAGGLRPRAPGVEGPQQAVVEVRRVLLQARELRTTTTFRNPL